MVATGAGTISLEDSLPAPPAMPASPSTKHRNSPRPGADASKSLSLNAGSALIVDLDAHHVLSSGYVGVRVNRAVSLGGDRFAGSFKGALPKDAEFTILNDSAVDPNIGTFAGLADGGTVKIGSTKFKLTYNGGNGNDVVLGQQSTVAIISGTQEAFLVGVFQSYKVVATGTPPATITETGDLPEGVTFNSRTGVLSGKPAAGQDGVYSIQLKASNGMGTPFKETLRLTIGEKPVVKRRRSRRP